MNVTIFGSTGALGSQCLTQSLDAGHRVTVLVRNANKLAPEHRERVTVIEGDALRFEDVQKAMPEGTNAVLFAIGVDKDSPEDLCADITRHILDVMRGSEGLRLVWCGGGSNLVDDDVVTFGARFVKWFGETFLAHRHFDKVHQLELLDQNRDLDWIGIRPLQMKRGKKTTVYRVGFNAFSGMSKISFADCAHAMQNMLTDDTWLTKAPIIQY